MIDHSLPQYESVPQVIDVEEVELVHSSGADGPAAPMVSPSAFAALPPRAVSQLALFYGRTTMDLARPASWSVLFNYVNGQLWEFWNGSDADPATGLPRTVAAASAALVLADWAFVRRGGREFDDRPSGTGGRSGQIAVRQAAPASTFPRFDLVPTEALRSLSHQPKRWSGAEGPWSQAFTVIMGHLWEFWGGAEVDSDSGLPHILLATGMMLELAEAEHTHPRGDDRTAGPMVSEGAPPRRRWWSGLLRH